jgi:hypothetical protein
MSVIAGMWRFYPCIPLTWFPLFFNTKNATNCKMLIWIVILLLIPKLFRNKLFFIVHTSSNLISPVLCMMGMYKKCDCPIFVVYCIYNKQTEAEHENFIMPTGNCYKQNILVKLGITLLHIKVVTANTFKYNSDILLYHWSQKTSS